MITLTATINAELMRKLVLTAAATGRSHDVLIALALESYLILTPDQIEQIKLGLEEADRGEFASDAEVDATFARFRLQAESD